MPNWSHQHKYVYFRLKRFLTDTRWEMKRMPLVGIRDLIHEVLRSMGSGKDSKDSKALIAEFQGRLAENPIFESVVLKNDRDVLVSILSKENGDKQLESRLISSFLKRLDVSDLPSIHLDTLKGLLTQSPFPYNKVDSVLSSFCLELAHSGFSRAYLTRIVGSVPDWNQTLWDFLQSLVNTFRKQKDRTLSVFFKMALPNEYAQLQSFQDVEIITAIPGDVQDCSDLVGLQAFLASDFTTVQVRRKASDTLRAAEEARTALGRLVDVLRLNRPTYDGSISEDVIVFDPETCVCHQEQVSDLPYQPVRVVVEAYFPLSTEPRLEPTSRDSVFRSLYWLRASESASSPESKLVAMWIATEFLFPSGGSSLEPVLKFVPSFVQLYFMPMTLGHLSSSLAAAKRRTSTPPEVLTAPRTSGSNYNLGLADHILTKEKDLLAAVSKDDLLVREISAFCSMMTTNGGLLKCLEDVERQVTEDLRRIYRYRNVLVHEAALSSHAIYRAIDRLNFYTSTLLNGIIFDLKKSPRLTIHEILTSRKESCNQYRLLLAKKAAADVLKDAVHPTILFSP